MNDREGKKVDVLVVDTAALLGRWRLEQWGKKLVTVGQVIQEVRDKEARHFLEYTSLEKIQIKEPDEEAIQMICQFARKTGDYVSLSVTDLRVLALTYMMEKELCGTVEHLRTEPLQPSISEGRKRSLVHPKHIVGPEAMGNKELQQGMLTEKIRDLSLEEREQRESIQPTHSFVDDKVLDPMIHTNIDLGEEKNTVVKEKEEEEDNEEDWITPENIREMKLKESMKDAQLEEKDVHVACITTDFAMQNVLLQMGLNLISFDGKLIRQIRNWVLRCHGCFKSTTNMTKKFCPSCGGHTLIKTSVSVDKNGQMRYHLKKNFQYNLRGTIYSMSSFKGGKNSKNPILFEDQKEFGRAFKAIQKEKKAMDIFDPDYIPGLLRGNAGVHHHDVIIGVGKKNPNEARRVTGKNKKKNRE